MAVGDPLLGVAIRMRLGAERDVAVLRVVHDLAAAIDAARDPDADVLIVGTSLLDGISGEALRELRGATVAVRLILMSAPSCTSAGRLAAALRAAHVVSVLEGPDRLLAAVRAAVPFRG